MDIDQIYPYMCFLIGHGLTVGFAYIKPEALFVSCVCVYTLDIIACARNPLILQKIAKVMLSEEISRCRTSS
mgnify:FL=1